MNVKIGGTSRNHFGTNVVINELLIFYLRKIYRPDGGGRTKDSNSLRSQGHDMLQCWSHSTTNEGAGDRFDFWNTDETSCLYLPIVFI